MLVSMKQVVLYTKKSGCNCGGEAKQALESLRKELGFTLKIVEIEEDPALAKKYMVAAPVVEVDGKVVSTGPTNTLLLRKKFKALK
jgi:predicted thioredoxin/glutaredoxin